MTDEATALAAVDWRAERAAALYLQHIEHRQAAYRSDDPYEWLKAGSAWRRFKHAALLAGVSEAGLGRFIDDISLNREAH